MKCQAKDICLSSVHHLPHPTYGRGCALKGGHLGTHLCGYKAVELGKNYVEEVEGDPEYADIAVPFTGDELYALQRFLRRVNSNFLLDAEERDVYHYIIGLESYDG